jgi:hypothetical protein
MSQEKAHQFRPPLPNPQTTPKRVTADHLGRNADRMREQQGWDAYRKWLSRVSSAPVQRSPMDHSVYSWKGYHNWADRVRQSWKGEDT